MGVSLRRAACYPAGRMSAERARAVAVVAFIAALVWLCACAWGWSQNGRYVPYLNDGVHRVLDTRTGVMYFGHSRSDDQPGRFVQAGEK